MTLTGIPPVEMVSTASLEANVREARQRTLELFTDLDDKQIIGPKLDIVNPMLWEIGHVAWFFEHFILQRAYGAAPLDAQAQALYDSIAIAHEQRWDLPLLTRQQTLDYMERVQDAVLSRLSGQNAKPYRLLPLSIHNVPRGHARRGLYLVPPNARISDTQAQSGDGTGSSKGC